MKESKFIATIISIILIAVLGTLFISCGTINRLQAEVDYYKQQADSCFWKEYAKRADAYIDAIYECDCDCIYDVVMEGDKYSDYIEYYERVHSRETE